MNLHNHLASINWRFNYFSKFNPGAEAPWGSTVWTYPSYTMCSIVCGSLSTGVLHDFATIFYHITPDFARTYSQFERTRWKTILSSSARRTGEGVQGVRKRGANCTPLHPLILFRNLYHYIGGDTWIPTLVGIKRLTQCGESFAIPANMPKIAAYSSSFCRSTRNGL